MGMPFGGLTNTETGAGVTKKVLFEYSEGALGQPIWGLV